MTGAEMIESFRMYYDRITSFSAPGYLDDEILIFLNNAQDDFIKERVFGKDFQPPAFEDNEKRVVDISPLLIASHITSGITSSTLYGKSWLCPFSSVASGRGRYTVKLEARVTRTNPSVTNEFIKCEKIRSENVGRFVNSAVNRTHFINPKFLEQSGGYYIIGDYYTSGIDQLKISVVMAPYRITETILEYDGTYSITKMSLNTSVHQEVVDMAVRQALQVSQDPRWQSSVAEGQIKSS